MYVERKKNQLSCSKESSFVLLILYETKNLRIFASLCEYANPNNYLNMKIKHIILSSLFGIAMLLSSNAMAQVSGRCPGIWFFDDESTSNGGSIFDTIVNCANPEIILQTHAFLPISTYNGSYTIEPIPYDPPEAFNYGTKLNVEDDDYFDRGGGMTIDFPFQFCGETQTNVTVGGNGIVTFGNYGHLHTGYNWNGNYPVPATSTNYVFPTGSMGIAQLTATILACASDIDPSDLDMAGVTNAAQRGIFKGAAGSYPCRHICFSWNEVPVFGHTSASELNSYVCTHQVVLYEGTNIIEIHVKKHYSHGTAGNQTSGMGLITPDGKHSFMVPGWNPLWSGSNDQQLHSPYGTCIDPTCASCSQPQAWRFTPNGLKIMNKKWYKYEGANADSLMRQYRIHQDPSIITDTLQNIPTSAWVEIKHMGEYLENGVNDPTSYLPDLPADVTSSAADSNCVAHPVVPTIYKCESKSLGATRDAQGRQYQYLINTFCFVDVDTSNSMTLESNTTRICNGQNATINLRCPDDQNMKTVTWTVRRIVDGHPTPVADTRYSAATVSTHRRTLTLFPEFDDVRENTIDTTVIIAEVEFSNGCRNNDEITIYSYPNFDVTETHTICQNQSYTWNGNTYSNQGTYTVNLQSQPGCDSIVHLNLKVDTVSHTIDYRKACKTFTWANNGEQYETSTNPDNRPRVTLQNRAGCDSVVSLDLQMLPLEAKLSVSPVGATLDELNIRLTDISVNETSRQWVDLTTGATSNSYIWNYAFPSELDSVNIMLHAISNLGCHDTAYVTIPMLKETMWTPNIFSPNAEAPNNLWRPVGVGLTMVEVYIYNRQGHLVKHWNDVNGAWDGMSDEGQECPQGAYAYMMRWQNVLNPNTTNTKTGTITLIR